MKLIILLIFGFLSIQESAASGYYYYVKRILSKYDYDNIYYNARTVCVDLSNYKDDNYIYFTFTLYDGWFTSEQYIYYTTLSTRPNIDDRIYLGNKEDYYSHTYDTYYNGYYDKYTIKYEIKKPSSDGYLCVGPSEFNAYYTSSYIEIRNVSSFGLSVGIIVVIVIACVAVVAASIIVYFCRRARRASYIAPPVAQYQPPVATAYPPPTYY